MRPSKYDETQKIMDTLLYQVLYSKDIRSPSIAYTNARMDTTCGTVYKIFVNNSDKEFAEYLYLHECGHIIFAHAKNMNARMDAFLLSKISVAYSRFAKYFNNYEKYLEIFKNLLFNVVMDFEVNSRLFTKEEWNFMNSKLENFLGYKGAKGMWPEDYGFPMGLTWNEYLNLILLNPDTFFEKLRELIDENVNETREGESDEGNPSEDGNDSGFDGKLTEAEYNKLRDELNGKENSPNKKKKAFSERELEELEKMASEHSNATYGIPTGNMDGKSNTKNKPIEIEFEAYKSMRDLVNKISRLICYEVVKKTRRDVLYNANRRKYDSTVMIPRYITNERHRKGNLYILLDVSGSVDPKMVNDFVKSFAEVKDNFKVVKFISWTTHLISEWNIGEKIPNKYGGGTAIYTGISYVQQKYKLQDEDTFFVISDFCDDLDLWQEELLKMKCSKFAIDWNTDRPRINPGFKKVLQYAEVN